MRSIELSIGPGRGATNPPPLTPATQHGFSTCGRTSFFSQHIALWLPPIAAVPG